MNMILLRAAALAGAAALLSSGCERLPVSTVQHGYRGLAMGLVYNPRTLAAQAQANAVPEAAPPADAEGPPAGSVYQNIQVLNDLNVAQLARLMVAMTAWVAPPEESCSYCHAAADMASDANYRKVVARTMLRMVRHINSDWQHHVAGTGVTCYTCHRGNGVPKYVWYHTPIADAGADFAGNRAGQNAPAGIVGLASLPNDPFGTYLAGNAANIRVVATAALPGSGTGSTIKQTEKTYGLMMHMSTALGVNCTYCHNSRSFTSWDSSTPQRATAWYGIRMVRDINTDYLESLSGVFPVNRKGPLGDVAKVDCATCHQGAYKPLYGVSMIKDYPELVGKARPAAAGTAAAAPATGAGAGPAAQ
jgi:photosynthetic reaction center cytochrome c subunit